MRVKADPRATDNARRLRRSMTFPEVLLWQQLRKRPGGAQFRRQHPAGPFVLDFFCATSNLAIEVDGEAHSRGDRPKRDLMRDDWLRAQDIQVMRIPAIDVLKNLDAVMLAIGIAIASK
jgi:very-short-patch-repair endonuclease